jgi:hypothetical protein
MAGTTISTATSVSVSITAANQLPLIVTQTGAISVSNSDAAYIAFALNGVVTNLGAITAAGSSGIGVHAGGAARVLNGNAADTTALISGVSAGVQIGGSGTLTNYGTVQATAAAGVPGFASVGAVLADGGSVVNGTTGDPAALISGASVGVVAFGTTATVRNFGTIAGTGAAGRGVWLQTGGTITNGSPNDTTALILGAGLNAVYASGGAKVSNFGTIQGARNGVELRAGGSVVNGSNADTTARIAGQRYGVYISNYLGGAGPSSVTNFGTIAGESRFGVGLYGPGTVHNGSTSDTSASISGFTGVYIHGAGSVTNFGTITGFDGPASVGLIGGGSLVNGAATSTAATITGGITGVYAVQAASVSNFGSIYGFRGGVVLLSGGVLLNGSAADPTAMVASGSDNAFYAGGPGTVTNFGTIATSAQNHSAVDLDSGGIVKNGSPTDTTALIASPDTGIYAYAGPASITNYGTIAGWTDNGIMLNDGGTMTNAATGQINGGDGVYAPSQFTLVTNLGTITATSGQGVLLGNGGWVDNGNASDTTALIAGPVGLELDGVAGVLNYGSIEAAGAAVTSQGANAEVVNVGTITTAATSGPAIFLAGGGLVTDAGLISTAGGPGNTAIVMGPGYSVLMLTPSASIVGTVDGGGAGTLELLGGNTTGSISDIGSNFVGFTSAEEGSGARWTLNGSNSIGTLTDNGTLVVAGSFDVSANLDPAGTGTVQIRSFATLEVAAVLGQGPSITFLNHGELVVDAAASFGTGIGTPGYVGPLLEHFGASAKIDLADIAPTVGSAGLVLDYDTASGLLTVSRAGGSAVASLQFQTSSLGAGSFHTASDTHGGTLLTHS